MPEANVLGSRYSVIELAGLEHTFYNKASLELRVMGQRISRDLTAQ